MRTTINLDDALLAKARQLSGIGERTALLHEALRALIARESARRLARLGGSKPQIKAVPRRPKDKQLAAVAVKHGLGHEA